MRLAWESCISRCRAASSAFGVLGPDSRCCSSICTCAVFSTKPACRTCRPTPHSALNPDDNHYSCASQCCRFMLGLVLSTNMHSHYRQQGAPSGCALTVFLVVNAAQWGGHPPNSLILLDYLLSMKRQPGQQPKGVGTQGIPA